MKSFPGILSNYLFLETVYGCKQRLSIHFVGNSSSAFKTSWISNHNQNSD